MVVSDVREVGQHNQEPHHPAQGDEEGGGGAGGGREEEITIADKVGNEHAQ